MCQNEETLLADPAQHPELLAIRAEGKLLDARLKQTGLALKAYVSTFCATERLPNAPAMTPGDILPPGTPPSSAMNALCDGLQYQSAGSTELASIDKEIVMKAHNLAWAEKGDELYESLLVELDALLSARAGIWQEQINMLDIIQPMLIKHGFPLQCTTEPATAQGE